ncbi:MAG: tetraacyldisaccharide 4'-kinase [Opitutales bacterium]
MPLTAFKEAAEQLETFVVDVIYDRRRDFLHVSAAVVLRTLSWLFAGIVRLRVWAYRRRLLHDAPLGCLVVVVGNLTVGGTGKTPVVEKFARSLAQRGRNVVILSRGYGSRKEPRWRKFLRWLTHREPPPPRVVSDGRNILLTAAEAGDEPVMLARNLPGVIVLVDRNRVTAGEYAIRRFGADVLLLDDGFQYLPLRGSLNLLMIDKGNPFGNGKLLPRGVLREPVHHMRRASYVFFTKSDGQPNPDLEAMVQRHKPGTDVIECTHQPRYLQAVFEDERLPLESLDGQPVATFSAIATPESFEGFVQRFGGHIVHNRRFLDHHQFREGELVSFERRAIERGAQWIVTTEKDAVRIPPDQAPRHLPIFFLRLEVEILRGAADFEEAVSRLCFPKQEMKPTRPPFPKET